MHEAAGHKNTPGTGGHLGVGAVSFMRMTTVRVLCTSERVCSVRTRG